MNQLVGEDFFLDPEKVKREIGHHYLEYPEIDELISSMKRIPLVNIGEIMQFVSVIIGSVKGLEAYRSFINDYNQYIKKYEKTYSILNEEYFNVIQTLKGYSSTFLSKGDFKQIFPLYLQDSVNGYLDINYKKGEIIRARKESFIEEVLYNNLVDFDDNFNVVRQFFIRGKRCDIFVTDTATNNSFIFELKKGLVDLNAVSQIVEYGDILDKKDGELHLVLVGDSFSDYTLSYAKTMGVSCFEYDVLMTEGDPFLILEEKYCKDSLSHLEMRSFLSEELSVNINYGEAKTIEEILEIMSNKNLFIANKYKELMSCLKNQNKIIENTVCLEIKGEKLFFTKEEIDKINLQLNG